MRVAIQGEAGSNSHAAVQALLGDEELVPCRLSAEVFEQLASRKSVDAAVLPVENSLHGAVADHSDLLLNHDIQIVGECQLRIHHALIAAHGVSRSQIKRVLSHPVALSQCRRFFAENPDLEAVPFYDTAGAARDVIERAEDAAIARDSAATIYGGSVLQQGLEDDPQNFTRFFLLVRKEDADRLRPNGAINKMSVAFSIPHQPGSLVQTLQNLASLGADLTKIESRPVPGKPWEYIFFVDLKLPNEEAADAVLTSLHSTCLTVHELGRYQSGSGASLEA